MAYATPADNEVLELPDTTSRPRGRLTRAILAAVATGIVLIPGQSDNIAASFAAPAPTTRNEGGDRPALSSDIAAQQPETLAMHSRSEVALPFQAEYADGQSARRALDCLTEAVYYEGALEPDAGQRAIAQVVLNRVRHPAYPNTVCGVVFEGQHLPTGCQFTFTCNGSRSREPLPDLWREARRVAKAALGGSVYEDVGTATHYHADYVDPYWSASLSRSGQIGRHIFYRWRGLPGEGAAFSSSYTGREPLIVAYEPPSSAIPGDEEAAPVGAGADTAARSEPKAESVETGPAGFKARPLRLLQGDAEVNQ